MSLKALVVAIGLAGWGLARSDDLAVQRSSFQAKLMSAVIEFIASRFGSIELSSFSGGAFAFSAIKINLQRLTLHNLHIDIASQYQATVSAMRIPFFGRLRFVLGSASLPFGGEMRLDARIRKAKFAVQFELFKSEKSISAWLESVELERESFGVEIRADYLPSFVSRLLASVFKASIASSIEAAIVERFNETGGQSFRQRARKSVSDL